MVTRVVYNNKAFKIINDYGYKFSNNEVTFNDIKIDFTGCSLADIPFKYQEIKIMQANSESEILNGEILAGKIQKKKQNEAVERIKNNKNHLLFLWNTRTDGQKFDINPNDLYLDI